MPRPKNGKYVPKKRKNNRNKRTKCQIEGCGEMVRSDHRDSHQRKHQRVYLRDDTGQFIKKNLSILGTTLPSGVPPNQSGYQVISKNSNIDPSGVPPNQSGYHTTILGTTNHRPGYQIKQRDTLTLSQSSFEDEEIPVFNFDPKLNSNMSLIEATASQRNNVKKSKIIQKN